MRPTVVSASRSAALRRRCDAPPLNSDVRCREMAAPKVMPLRRAILRAEEKGEIFAQPPFTAESKAMLVDLDVDGYTPDGFGDSADRRGFERFLDADTVNELLDAAHGVNITKDQLIELVI